MADKAFRYAAVAASITALACSLSACEQVSETARGEFGTVTVEPLPSSTPLAPAGTVGFVSARAGTYAESFRLIQDAIGKLCSDGRGYGLLESQPEVDPTAAGWMDREYPAGTRFSQTVECNGPLPNEIAFAAKLPEADAMRQVQLALVGDGEPDRFRQVIATVPFHDKQPKYRAFDASLGARLRTFSEGHCDGGAVVVRKVVVGSYPSPAESEGVFLNGSRMIVGTDFACHGPGDEPG